MDGTSVGRSYSLCPAGSLAGINTRDVGHSSLDAIRTAAGELGGNRPCHPNISPGQRLAGQPSAVAECAPDSIRDIAVRLTTLAQ
jgi:hypothetical protein